MFLTWNENIKKINNKINITLNKFKWERKSKKKMIVWAFSIS